MAVRVASGVMSAADTLRRGLLTPHLFIPAMVVMTAVGLAIDQHGHAWQLTLSAVVWIVLGLSLWASVPLERCQTIAVVLVATLCEVLASLWWGAYEYRLENLPLFVPAGHGIVYLVGLRLYQSAWAEQRRRIIVGVAIGLVALWATVGLTGVLGRHDVAGAIASVFLIVFLIKGRAPLLYAGVFFFVAFLEFWGTGWGTWYWAEELPGLGIPDGNPPSGIAAGYVLFDIIALAVAPAMLATWQRVSRRGLPSMRRGRRD